MFLQGSLFITPSMNQAGDPAALNFKGFTAKNNDDSEWCKRIAGIDLTVRNLKVEPQVLIEHYILYIDSQVKHRASIIKSCRNRFGSPPVSFTSFDEIQRGCSGVYPHPYAFFD